MKYTLIIGISVVLIPLFSCQSRGGSEEQTNLSEQVGSSEDDPSLITVTREQFRAVGMVMGTPAPVTFEDEVRATGFVRAVPSGRADVSGLIPGRIRKVYHNIGDRVERGEILFSLESNEFIELQQEYAVTTHREKQLAAEYERQKTLSEQQVIAEKEFLRTETEFRSMKATRQGLKARLQLVQVNPEQVENGTIVPYLYVRSPVGGFITSQNLMLGQYVMPEEVVVEVVDPNMLQLYLQVFERDLAGAELGQKVQFFTPDLPDRVFEAELSRIGRSIDPVNKTVICMATLDAEESSGFVNNLFVEARIITRERKAVAVPDQAVLQAGDKTYLLELQSENDNELIFRTREIEAGPSRNGYTEIPDQEWQQVLIEGAYDLWMEE